ncbi:hypothetical protein DL768_006689 [Monosporascus sp. mg162]|nr:hypothetical protein DL768_006689 [Monosporascus sp. mg162]
MPNMNHISKEEMRGSLQQPELYEVHPRDEQYRHMAPKHLVNSQKVGMKATYDVTIADFGITFEISDPPKASKIPIRYAAQEALFGINIGFCPEIWSYTCMILEVRRNEALPVAPELERIVQIFEVSLGPLLSLTGRPTGSSTEGSRGRRTTLFSQSRPSASSKEGELLKEG